MQIHNAYEMRSQTHDVLWTVFMLCLSCIETISIMKGKLQKTSTIGHMKFFSSLC